MVRVEFLIEGSQGNEYSITFEFMSGRCRALCNCQAGANNRFCKHRTALLDGDITKLRSDNVTDVTRLRLLVHDTDLGAAYTQMLLAIKAHEETKRALEEAKERLAKVAHR